MSLFTDEHIAIMQREIEAILDKYDVVYGKKPPKYPNYVRVKDEIQSVMTNLTDTEREGLPEGFQHITEFTVKGDKIRKFGRGDFNKETGQYERTKLDSDEKRLCIALYLTHPITQRHHNIHLTEQQLGLKPVDHHLPVILSRFLNPSEQYGPFSSLSLCGEFEGEASTPRGKKYLRLCINEKVDDLVYMAELGESKNPIKLDSKAKLSSDVFKQEKNAGTYYNGFILVTNEQNLVFFANRIDDEGDNLYLFTLAIHINTSSNEVMSAINTLVFFEHSQPSSLPDFGDGIRAMHELTNHCEEKIKSRVSDYLLKFNRSQVCS